MEELMKSIWVGIVVVLAALTIVALPAWSQDAKKTASTESGAASTAAEDEASNVTIADANVCQDVQDRSPVGISDVFVKEAPKVFCFCRVVGAEPGTQIIHNWYYNGSLKASVKLNVRSSNYRTWSSKRMSPDWDGEWMVEILSHEGQPLESIIFFVK